MTITTVPLSSDWILRAVDAPTDGPAARLPAAITATVPGTVHTDLLAAGLIDDPYLDLNELQDSWIGHTTWLYSTTFDAPDSDEHSELVFEGLDTVATISLNGGEIGRTANQHRTYRFDVSDLLLPQGNRLDVILSSAWEYAEARQADLGPLPNAYPTPFNFIRKMASNFGWDWGPQLVTAGIWKGVSLESWSTARLRDPRVTASVEASGGVVTLSTTVDSHSPAPSALRIRLSCGQTIVEQAVSGDPATLQRITLVVPDPDLWWPRGLGAQPLSEVIVELFDADEVVDGWKRRIGFRTVELDTAEDESGSAFTFIINGVPTVIRGANWIPDDCFPSRVTSDRYRNRIQQAADANLNLLRVWGGGIYERDEFFDICDEQGMLTWQDFLFACAAYPEEAPFDVEVAAEARDNVTRLAGHPSLVLWNGCNENIWGWSDWNWKDAIGDRTWGLGFYTDLLPAIVADVDPTTPYWPGSPYSGSPSVHANDPSRGNMHIWDVWNTVDYQTYAEYTPRFVSEFGFQGPPTWSTLTRAIHDEPLRPDSPGMLLHQKADDGNGKLERGMAPHLPDPASIEDWHYLTQINQSRAVEFGIEHFRSLKPQCMGTIVWQLNDCWPVTSWAAIDGDGRRKPLWHGLRRSNRERLVTIQPRMEGGLAIIGVNDSAEEWRLAAIVQRLDLSGNVLAEQVVSTNVSRLDVTSIELVDDLVTPADPARELLVVHVAGKLEVSRLFVEERDVESIPASLRVSVGSWREGTQEMQIESDRVARGVTVFADRLHPDAWADGSDLTVLPGEPTVVTVHSPVPLSADALSGAPVLRSIGGLRELQRALTATTDGRVG